MDLFQYMPFGFTRTFFNKSTIYLKLILYAFQDCHILQYQAIAATLGTSDNTPDMRQSKTYILSNNVDNISLATEFSIAICRPTVDKWQSKTPFLSTFDPRSSIVKKFFDCHLSGVNINILFYKKAW